MNPVDYALLTQFRKLFEGRAYLHRNSSQGDKAVRFLYEDLRKLNRSTLLSQRIDARTRVVNTANKTVGIKSRRGDGAFGELVPVATAITEPGFLVARGPISAIEIGAETKILAKAMIKQIDRVVSDLRRQVEESRRTRILSASQLSASTMPLAIPHLKALAALLLMVLRKPNIPHKKPSKPFAALKHWRNPRSMSFWSYDLPQATSLPFRSPGSMNKRRCSNILLYLPASRASTISASPIAKVAIAPAEQADASAKIAK